MGEGEGLLHLCDSGAIRPQRESVPSEMGIWLDQFLPAARETRSMYVCGRHKTTRNIGWQMPPSGKFFTAARCGGMGYEIRRARQHEGRSSEKCPGQRRRRGEGGAVPDMYVVYRCKAHRPTIARVPHEGRPIERVAQPATLSRTSGILQLEMV